jgi:hypothetical protein
MNLRTLSGFFRSTCPICYSRDIRFFPAKNYSGKTPNGLVLHSPLPLSKLLESILEIGIGTKPTAILCALQKHCWLNAGDPRRAQIVHEIMRLNNRLK